MRAERDAAVLVAERIDVTLPSTRQPVGAQLGQAFVVGLLGLRACGVDPLARVGALALARQALGGVPKDQRADASRSPARAKACRAAPTASANAVSDRSTG
ncbi:hypothetical protein JHV675_52060 [Mycobacterium avium subsp. hominissuis]